MPYNETQGVHPDLSQPAQHISEAGLSAPASSTGTVINNPTYVPPRPAVGDNGWFYDPHNALERLKHPINSFKHDAMNGGNPFGATHDILTGKD
jgi:hypothetical protein